jgi:hypothetical protein
LATPQALQLAAQQLLLLLQQQQQQQLVTSSAMRASRPQGLLMLAATCRG